VYGRKKERIPEECKLSIVCPVHRKGDQLNCQNYRGVSFLCTAYRIVNTIVYNKLEPYAEKVIHEYQVGFRP
jgi:sorting nexin-29